MISKRFIIGILTAVVFAGTTAVQAFPEKPIRMIVPYSPGGGTDTTARIIAEGLTSRMSQPVVIENRPGASGTVGTLLASRERADGYTLLFGIQATMALNPSLFKSASYQPKEDFDGVGLVSESPYVITVPKESGITNFEEFRDAASDRMTIANGGSGALLAANLLVKQSDMNLINIPYAGSGDALTDILAGRVNAMISSPVSVLPHIENGTLIPILVTSRERFEMLSNVPTAHEMGFDEFKVVGWYGIVAPKGVEASKLDIINKTINDVVTDPSVIEKLSDLGVIPSKSSLNSDEVTDYIAIEYDRWKEEISDAGIKKK